MLTLDGSFGEGGGQILRTALALSTCTQQPFHITGIRAARKNPGLQPQHLAAVNAAATISQAQVQGATKGSDELRFTPQKVQAGHYHFNIGTAGSTMLVLQTILPALTLAAKPSTITLEGGTHNPFAPPFTFIKESFLPLFNKMGARVSTTLEQLGFAPQGGGKVHVKIEPTAHLQPLLLTDRGDILEQYAEVLIAHLPVHIAERELAVIHNNLAYAGDHLHTHVNNKAKGPGNIVSVIIKSEQITECFSAFGQRGIPAEQVALEVVKQVQCYINAGVPVGPYLADQLLLPLALAGSGEFVTMKPSLHATTNMSVITKFIQVSFTNSEISPDVWRITLQ
jgi:RNA 3'-terminal phosphate cyclase (ATP)